MRSRVVNSALTAFGFILFFGGAAQAEQPGSKLFCSTVNITECDLYGGCDETNAFEIDAPLFLQIDLAAKMIETIREGDRSQKSTISSMARADDLIMLQGVEPAPQDGPSPLAWSISLDVTTGHMVVTASGRDIGYVVFGACTTVD